MLPMFMQKPFDVQYFQHIKRLFGTALIGYWPLDEAAGASTVTDYSGQSNNGTPSNVTFGQAGIGDGRTSGSFNGTSSKLNLYSAGLNGDFSGAEGTIAFWAKPSAAGVWTDSTYRWFVEFFVDVNNWVFIRKENTDNTILFNYTAGSTQEQLSVEFSSGPFFHVAMTWSAAADAVVYYLNGINRGSDSALGTWAGSLAVDKSAFGWSPANNDFYWSGNIQHGILLNRPSTQPEITELMRVSV